MIKIMTERQLNRIINEHEMKVWDKVNADEKFKQLERQVWRLEARVAKLESGEIPEIRRVSGTI